MASTNETTGTLRTSPLSYRVVLLAEDDPVLRRSLSDFLADEGFLVREASDVATVRRCVADGDPTALVLDLQLTDGDVADVLRDLAQREDRPNVVLMSATSRAEVIAREHRVQFVAKPLELDRLVQALLVPLDDRTSELDVR
jgi:DNA-binding NtrC family response regulator